MKSRNVPAFVRTITRYCNRRGRLDRLADRTRRHSKEFAWPLIVKRYVSALRSISQASTVPETERVTRLETVRTHRLPRHTESADHP